MKYAAGGFQEPDLSTFVLNFTPLEFTLPPRRFRSRMYLRHGLDPRPRSWFRAIPMSESAAIEPAQFFHLTLRLSASAGPLPPKMFFLFLYLFRSRSRYLSGLAARCARLPHLLEQ